MSLVCFCPVIFLEKNLPYCPTQHISQLISPSLTAGVTAETNDYTDDLWLIRAQLTGEDGVVTIRAQRSYWGNRWDFPSSNSSSNVNISVLEQFCRKPSFLWFILYCMVYIFVLTCFAGTIIPLALMTYYPKGIVQNDWQ